MSDIKRIAEELDLTAKPIRRDMILNRAFGREENTYAQFSALLEAQKNLDTNLYTYVTS